MSETLIISEGDKEEKYQTLLPQIKSLIEGEPDLIANLANVSAAIFDTFHHLWVGFYIVRPAVVPTNSTSVKHVKTTRPSGADDEELVLGPFQGPIACTRIRKGRGVCGTAWAECKTLVVPDVELFPGHIACSSLSRSEIVVPITAPDGKVRAVLDIDSKQPATFDDTDVRHLQEVCRMLSAKINNSF